MSAAEPSASGPLVPVGAVVAKRCTCGRPACHRESTDHPRYLVVGHYRHYWPPVPGPLDWDYALERQDTRRRHRTSSIVIRDQYIILSLPDDAVLVPP